jgi:hypothetical protein
MNEMESTLLVIYDHIKDWLKYGEAKNTALIGFNLAVAGGLSALMTQVTFSPPFSVYFLVILVTLVLSAGIGMVSMVPIFKTSKAKIVDNTNSVIFFADVASSFDDPALYLSELQARKGLSVTESNRFELDLAGQILEVAKIAKRKHEIFNMLIGNFASNDFYMAQW